jgi:hypothetical protein
MSRTKQASKRKRGSGALPVLGAAGLSLTLAGGASAAAKSPATETLSQGAAANHEIMLREEEVADVSLATFYVFDKERATPIRPGPRLAMGACGGGCGCGCSGCGCWTGTYYTSSVIGGDAYPPPPPPRPARRYYNPRRP